MSIVRRSVRMLSMVCFAAGAMSGAAEEPFWNVNAEWFMFAPAFDFPDVTGARAYRFRVLDDRQVEHVFTNASAKASLAPVWKELPTGFFTCLCEGLDAQGFSVGLGASRRGWKLASFEKGAYPPAARPYDQAATKVYDYLFGLDHVRYFREHGDPDPKYRLNCYPTKMHAALIRAMVGYAKLDPSHRDEALGLARKLADYLIKISEPAGAPLEFFPPTYETRPEFKQFTAETYEGQTMLLYPAAAGRSYLRLAAATGDTLYRKAAERIGDTYLKLQGADGTWPLKLYLKDGRPVSANRLSPTGVAEFLEDLFAATGKAAYREAADRAMAFVERGPMRDYNWEGQFEDVRPTAKYVNLTKHPAAEACIYLTRRYPDDTNRLAQCRGVMRFCEDQFVLWERPCRADGTGIRTGKPGFAPCNRLCQYQKWYLFPSVTEQYFWNIPIDASSAKMIRAFIAMWKVGHDPKDLDKARALGDALTRAQLDSGRIPTHFDETNLKDPQQDWINCMIAAAEALDELAEAHLGSLKPLKRFVGMEKGKLPGYVSVEGRAGHEPVYEQACADPSRPLSPDSLFWIASNTKGIAAATFLSLQDEGRIWLDDKVEWYLPEWKDCRVKATGKAPGKAPTFRMMLSHTAGLPFFPLNPDGNSCTIDRRSVRELSRLGARTPLSFEPGEGYDYSNWGIDVAMAAVEVVTGHSFADEMKRRVLDPLGMSDTCFVPSADQLARLAPSYRLSDGEAAVEVPICQFTMPYTDATRQPEAGGGLFSTARDMAKFFEMVANDGRLRNGRALLSQAAMDDWFSRQTPRGNPNSYSFGMCVWGNTLSHGGSYGTAGYANRKGGTYRVWLVSHEGANAGSKAARAAWNER